MCRLEHRCRLQRVARFDGEKVQEPTTFGGWTVAVLNNLDFRASKPTRLTAPTAMQAARSFQCSAPGTG
jgi:hypothetical protein